MVSKKNAALAPFLPPIGDKWFDDWVTPQRTAAIARILRAVGKSADDEVQLATDIFEAYVSTLPANLIYTSVPKRQSDLKK